MQPGVACVVMVVWPNDPKKAEHNSNHVHLNVNPFQRLKLHIRTESERPAGDSLKIVKDNEFLRVSI